MNNKKKQTMGSRQTNYPPYNSTSGSQSFNLKNPTPQPPILGPGKRDPQGFDSMHVNPPSNSFQIVSTTSGHLVSKNAFLNQPQNQEHLGQFGANHQNNAQSMNLPGQQSRTQKKASQNPNKKKAQKKGPSQEAYNPDFYNNFNQSQEMNSYTDFPSQNSQWGPEEQPYPPQKNLKKPHNIKPGPQNPKISNNPNMNNMNNLPQKPKKPKPSITPSKPRPEPSPQLNSHQEYSGHFDTFNNPSSNPNDYYNDRNSSNNTPMATHNPHENYLEAGYPQNMQGENSQFEQNYPQNDDDYEISYEGFGSQYNIQNQQFSNVNNPDIPKNKQQKNKLNIANVTDEELKKMNPYTLTQEGYSKNQIKKLMKRQKERKIIDQSSKNVADQAHNFPHINNPNLPMTQGNFPSDQYPFSQNPQNPQNHQNQHPGPQKKKPQGQNQGPPPANSTQYRIYDTSNNYQKDISQLVSTTNFGSLIVNPFIKNNPQPQAQTQVQAQNQAQNQAPAVRKVVDEDQPAYSPYNLSQQLPDHANSNVVRQLASKEVSDRQSLLSDYQPALNNPSNNISKASPASASGRESKTSERNISSKDPQQQGHRKKSTFSQAESLNRGETKQNQEAETEQKRTPQKGRPLNAKNIQSFPDPSLQQETDELFVNPSYEQMYSQYSQYNQQFGNMPDFQNMQNMANSNRPLNFNQGLGNNSLDPNINTGFNLPLLQKGIDSDEDSQKSDRQEKSQKQADLPKQEGKESVSQDNAENKSGENPSENNPGPEEASISPSTGFKLDSGFATESNYLSRMGFGPGFGKYGINSENKTDLPEEKSGSNDAQLEGQQPADETAQEKTSSFMLKPSFALFTKGSSKTGPNASSQRQVPVSSDTDSSSSSIGDKTERDKILRSDNSDEEHSHIDDESPKRSHNKQSNMSQENLPNQNKISEPDLSNIYETASDRSQKVVSSSGKDSSKVEESLNLNQVAQNPLSSSALSNKNQDVRKPASNSSQSPISVEKGFSLKEADPSETVEASSSELENQQIADHPHNSESLKSSDKAKNSIKSSSRKSSPLNSSAHSKDIGTSELLNASKSQDSNKSNKKSAQESRGKDEKVLTTPEASSLSQSVKNGEQPIDNLETAATDDKPDPSRNIESKNSILEGDVTEAQKAKEKDNLSKKSESESPDSHNIKQTPALKEVQSPAPGVKDLVNSSNKPGENLSDSTDSAKGGVRRPDEEQPLDRPAAQTGGQSAETVPRADGQSSSMELPGKDCLPNNIDYKEHKEPPSSLSQVYNCPPSKDCQAKEEEKEEKKTIDFGSSSQKVEIKAKPQDVVLESDESSALKTAPQNKSSIKIENTQNGTQKKQKEFLKSSDEKAGKGKSRKDEKSIQDTHSDKLEKPSCTKDNNYTDTDSKNRKTSDPASSSLSQPVQTSSTTSKQDQKPKPKPTPQKPPQETQPQANQAASPAGQHSSEQSRVSRNLAVPAKATNIEKNSELSKSSSKPAQNPKPPLTPPAMKAQSVKSLRDLSSHWAREAHRSVDRLMENLQNRQRGTTSDQYYEIMQSYPKLTLFEICVKAEFTVGLKKQIKKMREPEMVDFFYRVKPSLFELITDSIGKYVVHHLLSMNIKIIVLEMLIFFLKNFYLISRETSTHFFYSYIFESKLFNRYLNSSFLENLLLSALPYLLETETSTELLVTYISTASDPGFLGRFTKKLFHLEGSLSLQSGCFRLNPKTDLLLCALYKRPSKLHSQLMNYYGLPWACEALSANRHPQFLASFVESADAATLNGFLDSIIDNLFYHMVLQKSLLISLVNRGFQFLVDRLMRELINFADNRK